MRTLNDELTRLGVSLPTTHHEDWRYTNLAPLHGLPLTDDEAVVRELPVELRADAQLVFVNGRHMPALSTAQFADAVTISHQGQLSAGTGALAKLNAALGIDTAAIHVHASIRTPIRVLHLSTGMSHPRMRLVLDAGTEAIVLERFVSLGSTPAFTNAQSEVTLQEGASLQLVTWQDESEHTYHLAEVHVRQERASKLALSALAFGAKLGRTDVVCTLEEACDMQLRGLLMAARGQTQDVRTYVDHARPNAVSKQLFKAVLDGDGRCSYDGHIRVAPDAQKTNAAQKNQNLLLSKDAFAASKPHLEIYADDVKCAHGSTSGQLPSESLFYLRSRGISEAEAKTLLTLGFAAEVVPELVREEATRRVAQWLR